MIETTLLGETEVAYRLEEKKDYIPGQYTVRGMHFLYKNGNEADVDAGYVSGKLAEDVRARKVERIEIRIR